MPPIQPALFAKVRVSCGASLLVVSAIWDSKLMQGEKCTDKNRKKCAKYSKYRQCPSINRSPGASQSLKTEKMEQTGINSNTTPYFVTLFPQTTWDSICLIHIRNLDSIETNIPAQKSRGYTDIIARVMHCKEKRRKFRHGAKTPSSLHPD